MQLTRLMCPSSKYNIKCPYSMTPIGITVHNTANDASAMSEVSYMIGNNNYVSYHYAVDDYRIVQGIEENRNAFHASDGSTGTGNRRTISIEICYSKSGGDRFTKAEQLSAEFIASILKRYGWGIDRVKRHYDYAPNKKYCPHRTMDLGWQRFLNMIKSYMGGQPSPSPSPSVDYTGVITYQSYCNGKWQSEVKKADNTPSGYAGIYGKAISGFRCKPQYGEIIYEAHQLGGGWIGAVNSRDYSSGGGNSFAGNLGKPIDGIRIKSTRGYVDYRVHLKGGGWLEWARGFGDKGNSFAGIYGREIDGIQMK